MHKSLALNVLSSLVELDVLYWTLHVAWNFNWKQEIRKEKRFVNGFAIFLLSINQ